MKELTDRQKYCLSIAAVFWLVNEPKFLALWQGLSGGVMRPSTWRLFVEEKSLWDLAQASFAMLTKNTRDGFNLSPFLHDDFLDGIFDGETYVFMSQSAQIIPLSSYGGSALEAIASQSLVSMMVIDNEDEGVKCLIPDFNAQLFHRLALVFGFLSITKGSLLISKVAYGGGQNPLELDFDRFKVIISG